MAEATLVVIPPSQVAREFEISEGIISIGRAADNVISVEGDTSISRYHAEIEARGDEFWVYDLGSSNGTTVNDEPVTEDRLLKDGDTIGVGGETYIKFTLGRKKTFKEEKEEEEKKPSTNAASNANVAAPKPAVTAPAAPSSGFPVLLIIAGILGGLAVLAVAGIVLYMIFGGQCPGEVTILNPQSGTITGPTKIQVDFKEGDEKCIDRVIYQIDGKDTLEVEAAPYEMILDPGALPGFADGNTHVLEIVVENLKGVKTKQNQRVLLSYGTPITDPSPSQNPSPGGGGGDNQNGGNNNTPPPVSGDPKSMGEGLATKISGQSGTVLTPQLMTMINARMSEYRVAGTVGKAQTFKRDINIAFRGRGVPALIGYILAMSRSKFNINAKGSQGELGLWQIQPATARLHGYLRSTEQDTAFTDSKRGAEIAAAYLNDLISQFGNDGFMYAIACFGMTLEQVGQFKIQLEKTDPNRTVRKDFMQMVKLGIVTPEMQDRVVRFMAAGIIGENPQAFGLPDPPLSSLL